MDWNQIKFHLSNMSPEQLRQPAQVYDPYFGRLMRVETMDSLSSLLNGIPDDASSPLVLVGSKDRK